MMNKIFSHGGLSEEFAGKLWYSSKNNTKLNPKYMSLVVG